MDSKSIYPNCMFIEFIPWPDTKFPPFNYQSQRLLAFVDPLPGGSIIVRLLP